MEYTTLDELTEIIGGQIMSRVKVDHPDDPCVEIRRVIIPKAINEFGLIETEALVEENLKVNADEKKITAPGDIVMKLNSPFDCAKITEEVEGCIVPSFCVIIKLKPEQKRITGDYLLAFLNSKVCKRQVDVMAQSSTMTLLSVGKIKQTKIPIPDRKTQEKIGTTYLETQAKLSLLKKIEKLEKMKNDALFAELDG